MPRYAVIDVGTNSVKFNISERLRGRHMAHSRGPRRDHAARRGTGEDRRDQQRCHGTDRFRDRCYGLLKPRTKE